MQAEREEPFNVFRKCFSCKEGDSIIILSDNLKFSEYFIEQAKELNLNTACIYLHPKLRPLNTLSEPLLKSISESDAIILAYTPRQNEAYDFRNDIIDAVSKSTIARMASIPGIDKGTIECIKNTDYDELENLGGDLAEVLTKGRMARITSDIGTDLMFPLGRWDIPAELDSGRIWHPGNWDNLPAGEACITPVEGEACGKLVVDGGFRSFYLLEKNEKIEIEIRDGRIAEIRGKISKKVKKFFEKYDKMSRPHQIGNIYKLCELGIGTNRFARETKNVVEFEKKLGTIHMGFGRNIQLGGEIDAPMHLDMIVMQPTVEIDDRVIMKNGVLDYGSIKAICLEDYKEARTDITFEHCILRQSRDPNSDFRNGKLLRIWRTPGGKNLSAQVGNDETSILAAKVVKRLKSKKKEKFENICCFMNLSEENCSRLLALMLEYKVIEIE
ncbi:MAG: hypothetical protein HXS54_07020 [Theionarchaea archaeon]|nr:hypothetical protein [Theionarchaea archaeon]